MKVLAGQTSDAWIAFARTGNPNHKGLPTWPVYTMVQRATMVFDAPACTVVNDSGRAERESSGRRSRERREGNDVSTPLLRTCRRHAAVHVSGVGTTRADPGTVGTWPDLHAAHASQRRRERRNPERET